MSKYSTMNNGVSPSGFTKVAASETITCSQISATAPRDSIGFLTAYNIGVVVPSVTNDEVNAIAAGAVDNNPVPTILYDSEEESFVGITPAGEIEPFGGNPNSAFYGGLVLTTPGDGQNLVAATATPIGYAGATWSIGPLAGFSAPAGFGNTVLKAEFGSALTQDLVVSVHLTVAAQEPEVSFSGYVTAGGDPIPGLSGTTLLAAGGAYYNLNFSQLAEIANHTNYQISIQADKNTEVRIINASLTFVGA